MATDIATVVKPKDMVGGNPFWKGVETTNKAGVDFNALMVGSTDAGLTAFALRESGLATSLLHTGKAIDALASPAAGFKAYAQSMAALALQGGKQYEIDYDKLVAMGLPDDKCKEIALQKMRNYLRDEAALVNLANPMATNTDLMVSAAAKSGLPVHLAPFGAQQAGGGKISKEEKRAIYEKYRAKKKAKKGGK